MNKLLSTIALILSITLITTTVHAEEIFGESVCEASELPFFVDKRYFYVSGSNTFPIILADAKTIQINRKSKTIKVWTVRLASEEGRQAAIEALGQYRDYNNFGYYKTLEIYDYSSMRYTTKSTTYFSCNGNSIDSNEAMRTWDDIVPDSIGEAILESIIKKYNLK